MSPTPGELLVRLSTSATSSGAAAAADAIIATAPATARVASRFIGLEAWPTVLAESLKSPLGSLAIMGLSHVCAARAGFSIPANLPLLMSRICDGHHKMSFFHRQGRTEVGRRPTNVTIVGGITAVVIGCRLVCRVLCAGFRMPAVRHAVTGTGAGVRKPPKNEPAG
jgi:hypothetical protein